jgi:acetyl-CoA carboxylase biotin carboxyl carrier protein
MKPDGLDELKELIAFLKQHEVAEFDLDQGEWKVRLKFASEPAPAPAIGLDAATVAKILAGSGAAAHAAAPAPFTLPQAGAQPAASAPASAAPAPEEAHHILKSPIVGTFYESPSPGSAPFVGVGDRVEKGQVLCIVEAMKLMNEIEADASGEIVKRLVNNGQPVEYGQPLFAIRTA